MSPLEQVRVAWEGDEPTGLVTLAGARTGAVGDPLTERAVRWRVESGRWQRVHQGVYLRRPGPIDWPTRAAAALLAHGPGAALCGRSAGHLHGLIAAEPPDVEVLVPRDSHTRPRAGVTTRRGDHVGLLDRAPRLTTYEATVVDLAHGTIDEVVALLGDALRSRRTTAARVLAELARRPAGVGHPLLAEVVTDVEGGIESPLERRFVGDVLAAHGLPPGVAQVRLDGVTPDAERPTRRFDRAFPDQTLLVELDGVDHHVGRRRTQDRAKQNLAVAAAWALLRFGWPETVERSCATAVTVERVLAERGWQGRAVPCGPACPLGATLAPTSFPTTVLARPALAG